MWQLHLRRVGVEAQPDLVLGVPKGGSGEGPSEEHNGREDPDDPPKDDGEPSEGPSGDSQLHPAPEISESRSLDDQPLGNARDCHFVDEDMTCMEDFLSTFSFSLFGIIVYYFELLLESQTSCVK